MRAQTLNRGGQPGVQSRCGCCARRSVRALLPVRAMLLAAGLLAGAAVAPAQANPSANSSKSTQQNPAAQAQAGSPPPASSPASGPMILGENPDSGGTGSAPLPPASSPAQQPPASPAPGTLVRWNPARPSGESPAPPPAAAAAAPAEALAILPPANAGGDSARQQINNQCVDLLKMASDLKAEVDKTNQDILSVAVVRKADEIETLAHRMKEEMRPEADKK